MSARTNVVGDRMDTGAEAPDRGGISAQMGRMVDGFSRLVTQHLTLAKLELADEARAVGREVAAIAAFVPFVLVGYALLCVCLAFALGRWLGREGGFLLVGALNLVGGGIGIWRASSRLRMRRPPLERSVEELRSSAALLAAGAQSQDRKELGHGRKE
ncbi:MAG: phage holin family protein [Myxococcaceae bacterium]|nr:phage holin family protein [Myxococcaceae bacterium]MCI0669877.1 phage holin family protein [Myxococcaceae bacterium]